MKLPNGYGSVIRLSGKRRKPYAVRITTGITFSGDRARQTYKYLEYFEKRKDAMQYLAEYNSGREVKEHVGITEGVYTHVKPEELIAEISKIKP